MFRYGLPNSKYGLSSARTARITPGLRAASPTRHLNYLQHEWPESPRIAKAHLETLDGLVLLAVQDVVRAEGHQAGLERGAAHVVCAGPEVIRTI